MAEKRIDIPAEVRAASVVPSSINDEERTIDIVWTTGARVKRSSWWDGDFFEELSTEPKHVRMERLASGRSPFLADHASHSIRNVLGVITNAKLSKGQGTATVRFAKDDPEADAAWNKVRQGILPNVSVGYRIHKFEKVEGGDETTPVFRATDWEPHEVSLVTVGADAGAVIRSAPGAALNTCTLIHTESRDMSDKTGSTPPTPAPAAAPAPAPVDLDAVREQVRAAERERVAEITALTRRHGLEDLGVQFVTDGISVDNARALVLDELAKRGNEVRTDPPSFQMGDTDKDKRHRHMGAALLQRMGASGMVADAARAGRVQAAETDPGEFRGMSALELVRESLEAAGHRTRGKDRYQLIRMFFERAPGLATTGDLPVVMEEAINKTMLAAYATMPDTWRQFCGTREVRDFRPANLYRNGSFGPLDVVNEHGEYQNKPIPDGEKFSVTVEKRGAIIGLTDEMLINDDFGALSDLATRFGRSAGLTIESEVYAFLNANGGLGPTMGDTNPFFHAGRGNVNGTASALSVAGIDADRVVLGRQKDVSGNEYLAIQPAILLVPDGLASAAKVLNASAYDHDNSKLQKPNAVQGIFRDIVSSPRITGTRRYIFGDPNLYPVIYVVFLEGKGQGPTLESREGWRVDGIEWKVKLYAKVNPGDFRGAVTNAGTA